MEKITLDEIMYMERLNICVYIVAFENEIEKINESRNSHRSMRS
jgi:hypothetical protein